MIIFENNILIKSEAGFSIYKNVYDKLLFDIANSNTVNLYDDVDILCRQATLNGLAVIAFDKSRNIAVIEQNSVMVSVNVEDNKFEYLNINLDFILKI